VRQPTTTEPLRVLSLGAGVQSSTALLMSCEGVLPKLDAAIFADTGWEPKAVYAYLGWLLEKASKANIPVYRVSAGNIREDNLRAHVRGRVGDGQRAASLPYYTRNADGSIGAIQRQCTGDYKIAPVERKIRDLLELKPRQPWPKAPVIELWFGITVDEQRRMRISRERWKAHRYPLVFDLPKAFTRHECLNWMQEQGHPLPPRSSCLGCPFHSDAEWRALREDPEAWADVTAFDEAIRHKGGMRGELFLHRSGTPLVQLDLSTPEERGQGSLAFNEECLGYCGV
jgi:hypothetical protein